MDARASSRMQLRDGAARFAKAIDDVSERFAELQAERAAKLARETLNRHRQSGPGQSMADAIVVEIHGKVASAVNTHPGGHAMEKGQVPHVISGAFGSDKVVQHPGAQPVPHMAPAGREAFRHAREDMRKAKRGR